MAKVVDLGIVVVVVVTVGPWCVRTIAVITAVVVARAVVVVVITTVVGVARHDGGRC